MTKVTLFPGIYGQWRCFVLFYDETMSYFCNKYVPKMHHSSEKPAS